MRGGGGAGEAGGNTGSSHLVLARVGLATGAIGGVLGAHGKRRRWLVEKGLSGEIFHLAALFSFFKSFHRAGHNPHYFEAPTDPIATKLGRHVQDIYADRSIDHFFDFPSPSQMACLGSFDFSGPRLAPFPKDQFCYYARYRPHL